MALHERVLLVHGLAAHPAVQGDLLPGPAQFPGVGDLKAFQPIGQFTQGPHRPKTTFCRVAALLCPLRQARYPSSYLLGNVG